MIDPNLTLKEMMKCATESFSPKLLTENDLSHIPDKYEFGQSTRILREYSDFKRKWNDIKREYNKNDLASNIERQKELLYKEKQLIMHTINRIDAYPENAIVNIAFFAGLVSISLFVSAEILAIPFEFEGIKVGGAIIDTANTDLISNMSTMNPRILNYPAQITLTNATTIGKAPAKLTKSLTIVKYLTGMYSALKMMGMMVKYSDHTGMTLRSQKATGMLSKQLLTARLQNLLLKNNKKTQVVMAKQLLLVSDAAITSANLCTNNYMDNFVKQTDVIQKNFETKLGSLIDSEFKHNDKKDKKEGSDKKDKKDDKDGSDKKDKKEGSDKKDDKPMHQNYKKDFGRGKIGIDGDYNIKGDWQDNPKPGEQIKWSPGTTDDSNGFVIKKGPNQGKYYWYTYNKTENEKQNKDLG